MKKILFVIGILFCVSGFSQSFTLSELVKLSKYNEDDFDTYVTKKGYIFEEVSEKTIASKTDYTFLVKGLKTYYVSKLIDKESEFAFWVTFQTPDTKNYLSIKEELKTYGYKLFDKGTMDGSNYFKYKKGNSIVSLWSISTTYGYTNRTRVAYEISFKVINE